MTAPAPTQREIGHPSALTAPAATSPEIGRLCGILALLSLPVLLAPGAIGRASALASVATPANPWFVAGHAALLYLLVPLVAFSACTLVLTPGLLLAFAIGRSRTPSEWLFYGFGISLVLVSVASAMAQSIAGAALRGTVYALVLLGLSAATGVIAWWRAKQRPPTVALSRDAWRLELAGLVAIAVVAYYVLSPKLLFESFNGDGAHAFESSRLLLRHAMPFWPDSAGAIAGFPGITSMLFAFPNAWFLRLFGEVEFAARIPFLLYVPLLGAGLLTLARAGRDEFVMEGVTLAALLISLASYALAMAFSATYNPYSADIALPATQDTLLMIVWLGVPIAAIRKETGWLAWFIALAYISLPSGLILVGFWIVARWLIVRPRPWREILLTGGLLLGTMVIAAFLPRLLLALGSAPPGGEYGLAGILRYFAFLQFTDLTRFLYVAIPCGLFPGIAIFAWRSQDPIARALTLVTLAYFLFFFVQAHVSLHHFVPAMLLPVAVALRVAQGHRLAGRIWLGAAAIALLLALPRRFNVHDAGRTVGATVVQRVGDYSASDAAVFDASTLLEMVFPYDWDPAVPNRSYGGSPLVWNRYARHQETINADANYLLQRLTDPVPAGWRVVGSDSAGTVVLVRSDSILAAHRALRPPTPAGSRWLSIPRGILFRSVRLEGGPHIIDVVATLEGMGFDLDPLLAKLGVHREAGS